MRVTIVSGIASANLDPTGQVLVADGSTVGDVVELALGHRDCDRVSVMVGGATCGLDRLLAEGDVIYLSAKKIAGA